jgi:hypothetical protein
MSRKNRVRISNLNSKLDYSILEERKVLDGTFGSLVLAPAEILPMIVSHDEITVVQPSTHLPNRPTWTGEYIGLTVEDAQALAKRNGVEFRISRMDDEYFMLTMDYRPGRITAEVEKGIVVDYIVEGASRPELPPDRPVLWPPTLSPIDVTIVDVANEIETIQGPRTPSWTGEYLGLTIEDAQALATRNGVEFRISRMDDEYFILLTDYRVGRITAEVEKGIVVDYTVEEEYPLDLPPDCPAYWPPQLSKIDMTIVDRVKEIEPVAGPRTPSWTGSYIGLTVKVAKALAERNGVEFRISRMDDEYFMLTRDYRVGRITAEVENGIIVDYTVEEKLPDLFTPAIKPKLFARN